VDHKNQICNYINSTSVDDLFTIQDYQKEIDEAVKKAAMERDREAQAKQKRLEEE